MTKTELDTRLKLEIRVTDILRDLGVPAHILGYQFTRRAIIMYYDDPKKMSQITKVLYPTLANGYQTTSSRVERAIRYAVETSWQHGNIDTLRKYFGNSINAYHTGQPTNAEFIATLADFLRIEELSSKSTERLEVVEHITNSLVIDELKDVVTKIADSLAACKEVTMKLLEILQGGE